MSQPIPNLPHFPIDPASSGQVFESMRNELEIWCRSVADNINLRQKVGLGQIIALRVLRITGTHAANIYTARTQAQKKKTYVSGTQAFVPADFWEDETSEDNAFLIDPSSTSALATDTYVASWFQLYEITQKPAFLLMAGAGGSLPTGQYQYMVFGNVAQNQTGFMFARSHPVI